MTTGFEQKSGFTIPDPPSESDLGQCVHCGLCLPHCPTFRELHVETESPRGRLHLMRALGEGRVDTSDAFVEHISLCLDCRACEAACPSGVKFGYLMEATRAEIRARRPLTRFGGLLAKVIFRQLFPYPERLALLGGLLRAYQRTGVQWLVRRTGLLKALPGDLDEAEALLPKLSARFFEPRGTVQPRRSLQKRVAFFAGCVMRIAFAETNRATVRMLSRAGCEVRLPEDQVCCGALHVHAGEREQAKELARRNIEAFERRPAARSAGAPAPADAGRLSGRLPPAARAAHSAAAARSAQGDPRPHPGRDEGWRPLLWQRRHLQPDPARDGRAARRTEGGQRGRDRGRRRGER